MKLHDLLEPRAGEIPARDRGVLGVRLERDQAPAFGQGAGEPQGTVASERADLEDRARADQPRQQMEQLALVGRDLDRGQSGRRADRERRLERGILRTSRASM